MVLGYCYSADRCQHFVTRQMVFHVTMSDNHVTILGVLRMHTKFLLVGKSVFDNNNINNNLQAFQLIVLARYLLGVPKS